MTTGIDRRTGAPLSGWAHVEQSIEVILTSPLGSRVMRRSFGFLGLGLLGRNLTPSAAIAFCSALAVAIMRWEPRFRPTWFGVDATRTTAEGMTQGKIGLTIEGDYFPGALDGDFTVVIPKRLSL
jgi:hypothetical protein